MAENRRYRRNPAATATQVDDDVFLVEPASQEIFYLDAIGAALWRLLAEPQSLDELTALYGAAFPETDGKTIRGDLERALDELHRRGLVQMVP